MRVLVSFYLLVLFSAGCFGQDFYDAGTLQKIEIHFTPANWDYQLDTAKLGGDSYIMAQWVRINGTYFDSVGVKYKGNSSYDSTSLKNPLHLELDAFKNQSYKGYKDIKLSNAYDDPSMIREVMAYAILQNYMEGPKAGFAQVYVNGSYKGLYTNSEAINKTFLASHFYSDAGTFVKGNPSLTPSPNVKSNLKYIAGGDSSSYYNYYELKSLSGWKDLEALCDSVTNKPANIASIVDVDRATWMMAFNTLLINLDSYNGAFAQNYYIYKDNTQRFSPIIWDLNMSFGGFPFLGYSNSSLGTLSIANMQSLPINVHSTDAYWPLIKAIYANAMYKRMYVAHIKTMTNEFFTNQGYLTKYNVFKAVIDTAVQSDPHKPFSYTQFQSALTADVSVGSYSVPGIQTLMDARAAYLQTTAEFTAASPTITLVNSTGAALSVNAMVTITAQVTNASAVYLGYRFSRAAKFERVSMYDDGQHNDGAANDQVYGAEIILSANKAQYYIYAENSNAGIFSPERAEHEFYELNVLPDPVAGQLVINEFLADNKSDVKNEFHASEAWIELYNTSSKTLNLDGMYLTDDYFNRSKYVFPPKSAVPPYGFVTVWADGLTVSGSQLHADFKLSKYGEQIMLSNGHDKVLDSIAFGLQEKDISMGRCPDGSGSFVSMHYPSFGMYNCVTGIEESHLASGLTMYPNPTQGAVTLATEATGKHSVKVITITGQIIYENTLDHSLTIDTGSWPSGIYLVSCANATKKLIITK